MRINILFYFRFSKDTMQQCLPTDKPGIVNRDFPMETEKSRIGNFRCGKSFTMQGINTPGSSQRGVIPRSFEVRISRFICSSYVYF